MRPELYRDSMTERQLQDAIRKQARLYKWLCYHCYDSRRSPEGFPDLVLVKDYQLFFWELKTAKGRVTPEQTAWIEALAKVEHHSATLVRPEDLDKCLALLAGTSDN